MYIHVLSALSTLLVDTYAIKLWYYYHYYNTKFFIIFLNCNFLLEYFNAVSQLTMNATYDFDCPIWEYIVSYLARHSISLWFCDIMCLQLCLYCAGQRPFSELAEQAELHLVNATEYTQSKRVIELFFIVNQCTF